MKDSLIIVAISVILLILIEIAARIFGPQVNQTTYLTKESLGQRDAVLGNINRPKARARERGPEFLVEYNINQEGLRDETPHPQPKPSGLIRILLLGDSFTFGAGNNYDKIWPVVLEQKLYKAGYPVDIVKAGVPAFDTHKEVIYLERIFSYYQPDIVVFAFLPNDLFTNTPLKDHKPLDGQDPGNSVKSADISPDPAVKGQEENKFDCHSLALVKRLFMSYDLSYIKLYLMSRRKEYFSLPISEKLKNRIRITKELLLRAHHFCQERGADFLVLSIPQQFQVLLKADGYKIDHVNADFIDEIFSEFATEEGFRWLSVLTEMSDKYRSGKKDLYCRYDGHLNNYGNYLVGDYLAREFILYFRGRDLKFHDSLGRN